MGLDAPTCRKCGWCVRFLGRATLDRCTHQNGLPCGQARLLWGSCGEEARFYKPRGRLPRYQWVSILGPSLVATSFLVNGWLAWQNAPQWWGVSLAYNSLVVLHIVAALVPLTTISNFFIPRWVWSRMSGLWR